MTVEKIEVENFRNLESQTIDLDKKCTLFYGDNGQGKTNILEAVWLMSCGKSFRALQDREMINFESTKANVKLYCDDDLRKVNFEARLFTDKKKEIYINNERVKKNTELLGNLVSVLFIPDHLNMVKGSPENRRRFLDVSLCQQSKSYFQNLKEYNKLLDGRNQLLKQLAKNEGNLDVLDVWDEALAQRCVKISLKRQEYINALEIIAKINHKEISDNKEDMSLYYETLFDEMTSPENMYAEYLYKLKENRQNDIWQGNTSLGCHRDDLDITLNGISLKKYGSEGQKRSAVITLKLAEGAIIEESMQVKPIFLLDDVLSELDGKRREYIISSIKDFQVIITDCTQSFQKGKAVYRVKNGRVYGE